MNEYGCESVRQLKILTESLVKRIEDCTEEDFVAFVDQREQLVEAIHQSGQMENYRQVLSDIQQYDHVILARMTELRDEALTALNKVQQGKNLRANYQQTYAPDSILFDTKK